jgi:hypothetical protein
MPLSAATPDDIREIAMALPEVTEEVGAEGRAVYLVRGKAFAFHREPRKDAVDAETGERLQDVVVFHCPTPAEKAALVQDDSPFFTTPHFDGYNAVLLRLRDIGQVTREELTETIVDAWLARAPKRLATAWLADQPLP